MIFRKIIVEKATKIAFQTEKCGLAVPNLPDKAFTIAKKD